MTGQSAANKAESSEKKLEMSFDPQTIEHLGVKMYSNLPNALAELVANAYDADATKVFIQLLNKDGVKEIRVVDDGIGMNFDEINNSFLRIGRNRRQYENQVTVKGRKVTGKKGLGKLALFGIGERIEIQTTKEGDESETLFTLDWNDIKNTRGTSLYEPDFVFHTKKETQDHGTIITLKNLKRKSDFDPIALSESLSKLFNSYDNEFEVFLEHEGGTIRIDQKLKYESITPQFIWKLPEFSKSIDDGYEYKDQIQGEILSTEKPIKPALRGITLFARGRMVNGSEFFGVSESSHGFSYLTGWLNIDFIDDWNEDVISTDRQSLNWDLPKVVELRNYLQKLVRELVRDWRVKRNQKRNEDVKSKSKIDVTDWYDKLPNKVRNQIQMIVNTVEDKSELSGDDYQSVLSALHDVVPEYPYYHWRELHPTIQSVSKQFYENKDYYLAFLEAAKKYMDEVRVKAKHSGNADQAMMGTVFGVDPTKPKPLQVTKKYKRPDGHDFNPDTLKSIEEGQKFMSMGIVSGGRNPVTHELANNLRDSGLFTEKDCLDALGLLSHLFRRLDDA